MKNNITELIFILDRSGSMAGLESDTVGGFNAMLEKQKQKEGKAWVSTVLFDHERLVLHDRLPLEEVPPMTLEDYTVRGCTALLDALGEAISHIKTVHKYARPEDVPEHTIFVITTDGMENASRSYNAAKIKEMVQHQTEKHSWEFLFFGAGMDAIETASSYGIAPNRAATYHSDRKGTRLNYEVMSQAICSVRNGDKIQPDWKKKIEEDHKRRGS